LKEKNKEFYSLEPSPHKVLVGLETDELHGEFDVGEFQGLVGSHLLGPVEVALDLFLLHQLVEHENSPGLLLPYHQPEVAHCVHQRSLGQDVLALGALQLKRID